MSFEFALSKSWMFCPRCPSDTRSWFLTKCRNWVVVQDPTDVKNVSQCAFETVMKHPVGCPVVTTISRGGWGWFGTIIIVLVCGFIVYMAIGIAYRVTVLGVSGFEAIPNLDFWQDLPSKIKKFSEYVYGQGMDLYHWFRQSSYTRINR
jgi:hypothetical protein